MSPRACWPGRRCGAPAFGPRNHFASLALFPIVIWAALRFGLQGATLATVLISIATVAGTVDGLGPFADADQTESLTRWWLFASVVSVTGLLLASSHMERNLSNAIFEAEGALLVVLDAEHRIQRVNQAFELATGFAAAALRGQRFDVALVPEDQRAKVLGHRDMRQMRVSDRGGMARLESTVIGLEFVGSTQTIFIDVPGGHEFRVQKQQHEIESLGRAPGRRVGLSWDPKHAWLLPQNH